jgi:hypothetical protein
MALWPLSTSVGLHEFVLPLIPEGNNFLPLALPYLWGVP